MTFANFYRFNAASRFTRILPLDGGAACAIGACGDRGVATGINPDGSVAWSRHYALGDEPLAFIDGVAAPAGFTLLATLGGPYHFRSLVLVHIDAVGAVLWARLFDAQAKGFLETGTRLMRAQGAADEYLISAWQPPGNMELGSTTGRLFLLDAHGVVQRAVEPRVLGGGRFFDVAAIEGGYRLVGEWGPDGRPPQVAELGESEYAISEMSGHGLVLDLDSALNVRGCWHVDGETQLSLRGVAAGTAPSASQLLAMLRSDAAEPNATAVLTFDVSIDGQASVFGGTHFVAAGGRDRPARFVHAGGGARLILDRPDRAASSVTLTRIDAAGTPTLTRAFRLDSAAELLDVQPAGDTSILIAGASGGTIGGGTLLLGLDTQLDCCLTNPLPPSVVAPFPAHVTPLRVTVTNLEVQTVAAEVTSFPAMPTVISLCGAAIDDSRGEQLVQSPYLNLQAAGSMGTGAAKGVLLRWFFDKTLGAAHLPKGDLATTTNGFNRPNDFVALHRAEWPGTPRVRRADFTGPTAGFDPAMRVLAFRTGPETPGNLVYLRFLDAAAFAAARQAANAASNPAGFLAAYGAHPIEIELRGRIALACDLGFQAGTTSLRVETLSVAENRPLAPKKVSSRRILGAGDGPVARLFAENMRSLRVECSGGVVTSAAFLCYDDMLSQLNEDKAWTLVDSYALSLNQAEVFRRLEDPARFQVHGQWRNFNDGAFVNVANYHDRWTAAEGLGTAVQNYVQLSDTDPQAIAPYAGFNPQAPVPDPNMHLGSMSLSYLGMLQLVTTNFHIARMLGLGCVDAGAADPGKTYLHLIEYLTEGDLGDGVPPRTVHHLRMNLPTRLDQERLAAPLELDPVEYGLSVPTGSGAPYWLTDPQGYTPDGQARYIRLYPGCAPLYAEDAGFFDPPLIFDLASAALPVFYGIEYRGAGEVSWRRPEIAHDPAYLDTGSPAQPEPRPSPFPAQQRDRAFVHKETEPGPHEYAAYGIDLFSRGTALSPVQATDATAFVRPNRLLPPTDLSVQLIQPEDPRVLTTQKEQQDLALLPPGDKTLARICFNYGFAQDAAYDFAAKVEIFFRDALPATVAGAIAGFASAGPQRMRIVLGPYSYASPPQTVTPTLTQAAAANFVGGVLVAGGRRLIVEQVEWAVPAFTVVVPAVTGVEADGGTGTLVSKDADLALQIGDLATAIENMAAAASWGAPNPLTTQVMIGDASWTIRDEQFTRPDGTAVNRRLRGVWETAKVKEVPAGSGRYEIDFDSYQLPPHPQSGAADPVDWWKGAVRVSVAGRDPEDRKALTVKQIIAPSGSALKLIALDESADAGAVVEGTGLLVNFYPGYRVYLHADPPGSFDEAHILPPRGGGSRTTLIGLRSVDPSTLDASAAPYRSAVGVPQLLTAIEIRAPLPPRKPGGLAYATQPDAERKSSYTLNAEFDHEPFAASFFRADALSVFHALYSDASGLTTPSTYETIVATIFPIERDPWFGERCTDLFAYLEPGSTAAAPTAFTLADGTDYALPVPDAQAFADRQAMREAMLAAFTALTEQPLIFDLISDDADFIPSKRRQTVRNSNGDLLYPGDSEFDLSPMAKRPGGNKIQFTDFTLDGSMHPDTLYFYFVRELGNRMEISEPSPIFGPVKLVNLTPPPAPVVRNLASAPFDLAGGTGPRVTFEVVAPSPLESIARLRIHRTTDPADALSVRTMPMVSETLLSKLPAVGGVLTVTDAFDVDPPYGDPLFYRLVWVREVAYDDLTLGPQTALAVSEPSPRLLTNLADVVNPEPPVPTLSFVTVGGDTHLRFAWTKTVHNGVYRLSHLNTAGVWARIATLASNAAQLSVDLAQPPPMTDEDGNPIYHRFKIDVENSSGLLNRRAAPITVDLTAL